MSGYVATGLLDQRRATRPIRDLSWPETQQLPRTPWRWPYFGRFRRRPFDWRID